MRLINPWHEMRYHRPWGSANVWCMRIAPYLTRDISHRLFLPFHTFRQLARLAEYLVAIEKVGETYVCFLVDLRFLIFQSSL